MDVPELLRRARDRRGLSQRDLAAVAGSSQSALSSYERGGRSPTVRTLDRLLAACGLQVRAELEPLLADVDERLDAALAVPAGTGLVLTGVRALQRSLDLLDTVPDDAPSWQRVVRRGPVTWALDGASALAVHGLVLPHRTPEIVVVLDEALRWWLWQVRLLPVTPDGRQLSQGWPDLPAERFPELLEGRVQFVGCAFVTLRVVEALPPCLRAVVVDSEGPLDLPVLTADAVEQGHPAHSVLLARWRLRRTVGA